MKVVPTESLCFVVSPPSLLDDQAADLNTYARRRMGEGGGCDSPLPNLHTEHLFIYQRNLNKFVPVCSGGRIDYSYLMLS